MMHNPLTSRERVEISLNHQEPDRVPVDITFCKQPYETLRIALGLPPKILYPDPFNRVIPDLDLIEALDLDFTYAGLNSPSGAQSFRWDMDEYVDYYGVIYRPATYQENSAEGRMWQMIYGPFHKNASLDDINNFEWIDPNDPHIYEGVQDKVKHIYNTTNKAISMRLGKNIWDLASYMRGQEAWWIDLSINLDFCIALMNKIADIQREIYLRGIELVGKYISIIRLGGDDFGTQRGLLISPDMFRKYVKPILASVFLPLKEKYLNINPNGKLMLHSCGSIRKLIPDFIDIGADILDPVQPNAKDMNGLELKREFGKNISFHGGLDTQNILPFGSMSEWENEVKHKIEMFAPGGGFILNPSHDVIGDVDPKKLIRMVELAKSYGIYPIKRNYSEAELLAVK
jgi:uroporphyrinogen decarboxylase